MDGEANSKQAGAAKTFAEEEKAKIENELQRRALPADLRRREAEASMAEIQVERERAALNVDLRKRSAEAEKRKLTRELHTYRNSNYVCRYRTVLRNSSQNKRLLGL